MHDAREGNPSELMGIQRHRSLAGAPVCCMVVEAMLGFCCMKVCTVVLCYRCWGRLVPQHNVSYLLTASHLLDTSITRAREHLFRHQHYNLHVWP